MIEWSKLENSLLDFYKSEYSIELSSDEKEYLEEAFIFTEELWSQQYDKMSAIKYVMLSEAPLFGEKQNYFYNIETSFSSFFFLSTVESNSSSFISPSLSLSSSGNKVQLNTPWNTSDCAAQLIGSNFEEASELKAL